MKRKRSTNQRSETDAADGHKRQRGDDIERLLATCFRTYKQAYEMQESIQMQPVMASDERGGGHYAAMYGAADDLAWSQATSGVVHQTAGLSMAVCAIVLAYAAGSDPPAFALGNLFSRFGLQSDRIHAIVDVRDPESRVVANLCALIDSIAQREVKRHAAALGLTEAQQAPLWQAARVLRKDLCPLLRLEIDQQTEFYARGRRSTLQQMQQLLGKCCYFDVIFRWSHVAWETNDQRYELVLVARCIHLTSFPCEEM